MQDKKCQTCGQKQHDFSKEEAFDCVPSKNVLQFGNFIIDKQYREALFNEFPMYTSEEIVGSYLGKNPFFPSQDSWLESKGLI